MLSAVSRVSRSEERRVGKEARVRSPALVTEIAYFNWSPVGRFGTVTSVHWPNVWPSAHTMYLSMLSDAFTPVNLTVSCASRPVAAVPQSSAKLAEAVAVLEFEPSATVSDAL